MPGEFPPADHEVSAIEESVVAGAEVTFRAPATDPLYAVLLLARFLRRWRRSGPPADRVDILRGWPYFYRRSSGAFESGNVAKSLFCSCGSFSFRNGSRCSGDPLASKVPALSTQPSDIGFSSFFPVVNGGNASLGARSCGSSSGALVELNRAVLLFCCAYPLAGFHPLKALREQ